MKQTTYTVSIAVSDWTRERFDELALMVGGTDKAREVLLFLGSLRSNGGGWWVPGTLMNAAEDGQL